MRMNLKPGDRTTITTANISTEATVVSVTRYEYGSTSGWEVVYDIPGYGITQPYWYDDRTSYADSRRARSGMPAEYVYKRGQHFRWDYYGTGEEIDAQKNRQFLCGPLPGVPAVRPGPLYLLPDKGQREDAPGLLPGQRGHGKI